VKTSLGQPRGGTFLEVGFSGVPHRVGCREADLSISAQPNCENDRGLHSSARMAGPLGQAVVEASTYGFGCEDETFGPTHRFASANERVIGIDHPHFGADCPSQARFTGLLRQTNEPRTGSPSTSVANEPRFNCRFGDDRATIQPTLRRQPNHDSTDTSVSTESPGQPACASAQTNRLRRDSPVCFGKRTSHRD